MNTWRARLWALRNENWAQIHTDKYWQARNCPPCGFELVMDDLPKTCHLRICPFCHGRRVSSTFMRIHRQLQVHGKLSLIEFHGCYGPRAVGSKIDPIKFLGGRLDEAPLDNLLRIANVRRRRLRYRFAGDGVGAYQIDITARHRNRNVAAGGSWATDHRMLVTVADEKLDLPKFKIGQAKYCRVTDAYQLARLVAKAFPYNLSWLYSDATITADLLNILHSRRLFSTIGAL